MQTFLPYPSFSESARVLDRARLGKQRVEALQILGLLVDSDRPSRWRNHPAVRMWRGHEACLALYGDSICREWVDRGYRDTTRRKIADLGALAALESAREPAWLGDDLFHASHRANLVRKLPDHYGPLWPDADPTLPYVWPTSG